MVLENWIKLKEKPIETGRRKVLHRTYQLPEHRVDEYDIKQEGPAVYILGLTDDRNIVLAKQFRPGPERILLELPGCAVECDKSPKEAASREFLEETGFNGSLQLIGTSLDCVYSTMLRYNFVAARCRKVQEPRSDGNEFIEVVEMPMEYFRSHLIKGDLTDIESGYLGLDFF